MKGHDGYNPAEMPRRESEHGGAGEPVPALRPIDTSLGVSPAPRARPGDRVSLWIDVIRPEKRGEWERLLHDVLGPAVLRCAPAVLRRIRLLEPAGPNPDGSWTFAIVPDPYVEDVEYDAKIYVEEAFGRARADEFDRGWDECHATPQYTIELRESAW
jgi:hypothetical protein